MKKSFLSFLVIIIYLAIGCAKDEADGLHKDIENDEKEQTKETGYGDGRIIVCGSNKVYIINLKNSTRDKQDIEWEWSADQATDIPTVYKTRFNKMDECKPSRQEVVRNPGRKLVGLSCQDIETIS